MQFSLNRVWLLCRKQLAENTQLYILGMLAATGIISAILLFNLFTPSGLPYKTQEITFFMGLIASGAVFTSTILSQFNDKVKGIQALTLPASTIEKLTTAIIYSVIVFPVIYLIMVYPPVIIAHLLDVHSFGHFNTLYKFDFDKDFGDLCSAFIIIQTVMLLGSVLFKRYIFIKTAILIIVTVVGVTLFNPYLSQNIIGKKHVAPTNIYVKELIYSGDDKLINTEKVQLKVNTSFEYATPYQDINISYGWRSKLYDGINYASGNIIIATQYNYIFHILLYLALPFLWIITWFKLKEKEL
jgi:hypothetical protein